MEPELKQDVVGFEGGIRGQIAAPIALRTLDVKQSVGRCLEAALDFGRDGVCVFSCCLRAPVLAYFRGMEPVKCAH